MLTDGSWVVKWMDWMDVSACRLSTKHQLSQSECPFQSPFCVDFFPAPLPLLFCCCSLPSLPFSSLCSSLPFTPPSSPSLSTIAPSSPLPPSHLFHTSPLFSLIISLIHLIIILTFAPPLPIHRFHNNNKKDRSTCAPFCYFSYLRKQALHARLLLRSPLLHSPLPSPHTSG